MEILFRKLIACSFLILFLNLGVLIFTQEVYFQLNSLIVIIIFNIILSLDIIIRPISSEKDQFRYSKLSVLLFLLLPLIVILPYLENKIIINQFFKIWDNLIIYLVGTSLLITGGIILIYSRLLLGKFGGPKITIEENHYLIIKGIYKYIRHPIYLGMMLVFFGFALSFNSLILPFSLLFGFFFLFKNRMDLEESILKERFGKEYEVYITKTKRLIPFIY